MNVEEQQEGRSANTAYIEFFSKETYQPGVLASACGSLSRAVRSFTNKSHQFASSWTRHTPPLLHKDIWPTWCANTNTTFGWQGYQGFFLFIASDLLKWKWYFNGFNIFWTTMALRLCITLLAAHLYLSICVHNPFLFDAHINERILLIYLEVEGILELRICWWRRAHRWIFPTIRAARR